MHSKPICIIIQTGGSSVLRYTLKRLAVGILTLAALATITFFLMKIIPGSPFGGELAQLSPEVREMLYAQYNLDKSIPGSSS